mmetsp:Transcript_8014/g.11926  ORF Transcript_8014/g.11926 Transcript_8014/m.11926 type:complete len:528 (-) Transcript_8014:16-1599(-)
MVKKSEAEKELMFFRESNVNPDAIGRRRHSSKPTVLKPRSDGLDMDEETRKHLLKRIRKIPVSGQAQPKLNKPSKKPLLIKREDDENEDYRKESPKRRRRSSGGPSSSILAAQSQDSLMQTMMRRLKMLETKSSAQKHAIEALTAEKMKLQDSLSNASRKQMDKQQQIDKMLTLIEQMAEYMNKEDIKHPFYDKIIHISSMGLDDTLPNYDDAFVGVSENKNDKKKDAVKKTINIELIEERVGQLNSILTNERKVAIKGKGARFEEAPSLTLTFYSNGMLIDNRSFRPYDWNITKAFLTDILDGYFPYEFKDTYPDGVRMDVINQTKNAFDKADHLANQVVADKGSNIHGINDLKKAFDKGKGDKNAFLAKLPKQVIRDGKLIAVRADIRNMLSSSLRESSSESEEQSKDHFSEEALSQKQEIQVWTTCLREVTNKKIKEPYATLRFRLPPMEGIALRCMVVHIYGSETIGQLRAYVDKHINRKGSFDYRIRAYPNTWLDNDAMTIQAAGLLPNATLFIQGIQTKKK